MNETLRVRAYGKINLYLDVLGRRPDGYTDIETVFQTVSLCDEIEAEPRASGIEVSCTGADVGPPEQNLAYRAAVALQAAAGVSCGARIRIVKRLPVAGGMAGGSVDGAAALLALDRLWNTRLAPPQLHAIALGLGSDVPYCLHGGAMAATGRGERLEALPPLPETWFVLLHPPVAISAASVYNHPKLARSPETLVQGRTPAFRRALERIAGGGLAGAVFNRMESAVLHDRPDFARALERLRGLGCAAAAMSGSGPTLFGLCRSEAHARAAAAAFPEWRTSVVHSVPRAIAFV